MNTNKSLRKIAISLASDGCFEFKINNRSLRTSKGKIVKVPSKALARAISRELKDQFKADLGEVTPLFRLACIAIEQVMPNPKIMIDHIIKYAETDLLCYWADPNSTLGKMQTTIWQPILSWVADTFDAKMEITHHILPIKQSEEVLVTIRKVVEGLGVHQVAALIEATRTTGSIIVGLAVIFDRISIKHAIKVSQLDEIYQEEKWGSDEELSIRRANIADDLYTVQKYIKLLNSNPNID